MAARHYLNILDKNTQLSQTVCYNEQFLYPKRGKLSLLRMKHQRP